MPPIWRDMDLATLDREYNARATVPDFDAELRRYQKTSAHARATLPHTANLIYDPASNNALDWFPGHPGAPIFLWIHGGYWRALSKSDNACIAPGLTSAGIHVAIIDYSLAPAVTLDTILHQVRTATTYVHTQAQSHGADPTRLYVGGSSAGAHLAAMLASDPPAPIKGAICLSGLYDLEPIRLSHINAWLNLDQPTAARLSPQNHIPKSPAPTLLASVGGLETSEFKRQTHDYAAAWSAAGHRALLVPEPARHHFDIVLSLGDPATSLCQAAKDLMLEG